MVRPAECRGQWLLVIAVPKNGGISLAILGSDKLNVGSDKTTMQPRKTEARLGTTAIAYNSRCIFHRCTSLRCSSSTNSKEVESLIA